MSSVFVQAVGRTSRRQLSWLIPRGTNSQRRNAGPLGRDFDRDLRNLASSCQSSGNDRERSATIEYQVGQSVTVRFDQSTSALTVD
jgi:hypothetical protein